MGASFRSYLSSKDYMIWHILAIVILSGAAGFLYTAGGSGKYPRWFREVGVMLCELLGLLSLGIHSWWLIAVMGITYGAQTTYFKKKGTDAKLWNWVLVGFAFSLTVLPVVISNHLWVGFAIRTIFLTPAISMWSEFIGVDYWEEGGRGGMQIASLPLLLILAG